MYWHISLCAFVRVRLPYLRLPAGTTGAAEAFAMMGSGSSSSEDDLYMLLGGICGALGNAFLARAQSLTLLPPCCMRVLREHSQSNSSPYPAHTRLSQE